MSGSFCLELRVGFDRGDDGLDGDVPGSDQLGARAPRGQGERSGPEALADESRRDDGATDAVTAMQVGLGETSQEHFLKLKRQIW